MQYSIDHVNSLTNTLFILNWINIFIDSTETIKLCGPYRWTVRITTREWPTMDETITNVNEHVRYTTILILGDLNCHSTE